MSSEKVQENVQEYYGKILKTQDDLQTTVCTTGSAPPQHVRDVLKTLHHEVVDKYYGCGSIFGTHLKGLKVLDLGCGSGRDCYVFSKLVGESGSVFGIDMTSEQIEVAKKHVDFHTNLFGYSKPNVHFVQGYIEDLDGAGLPDEYFDLIISNCVINLSPKKEQVLQQALKKLKVGGEMYFSDIYSDRRVPEVLRNDPVLWGECISGALYWFDFQSLWKKAGFSDCRTVSMKEIGISSPVLKEVINKVSPKLTFYSVEVRLWKVPELEPFCEDYGQAVMFVGTSEDSKALNLKEFILDQKHVFELGRVVPVCGNTFNLLSLERFKNDFKFFQNEPLQHFGIFPDCGISFPLSDVRSTTSSSSGASSCCG